MSTGPVRPVPAKVVTPNPLSRKPCGHGRGPGGRNDVHRLIADAQPAIEGDPDEVPGSEPGRVADDIQGIVEVVHHSTDGQDEDAGFEKAEHGCDVLVATHGQEAARSAQRHVADPERKNHQGSKDGTHEGLLSARFDRGQGHTRGARGRTCGGSDAFVQLTTAATGGAAG